MRNGRDEWALQIALVTAQRSTCLRKAVGCVLLNARGHVLSTGYNGAAAGLPHCNGALNMENTCRRANQPSGSGLDNCLAIHAEQNALLQCRDIYDIHTCYVTHSPCMTCTKLLLNTSCERIVFIETYPQPDAMKLWVGTNRTWKQLNVVL